MSSRNRFKKTVFNNGLTLLSERHPEYRSLSIGVWVKVGTRHEKGKDIGVSHFLEHMLFKGTDDRTSLDIAREVDRVGGDFNAFTTREYTCFHILMLSRDVSLALNILSDVVLNSNFSGEEFDREKKVILQEVSMVEESPEELVHDLYFELVYGNHGLGRPILGTESSIRRMKRRDLLQFFRKHYRPDHMIISVSGNITHEAIARKLKSKMSPLAHSKWPGRDLKKVTKKDLGFEPAPELKPGCWWITRATEQVHMVWGVEGVHYQSTDRFAAYLLNVFLGGGMSSELFQEIREKNGLAYTVYSSLFAFIDSGIFTIYAATSMKQVQLCLKLIEECVVRLKKDLLSEEDLQTIKDNLKGTILLESDDVESRMSSIARNHIFLGKHVTVDDVCKMIDQVTAQDLKRVARKLFRTEKRSLVIVGPKPSREVKSKLQPIFPKKYQKKPIRT